MVPKIIRDITKYFEILKNGFLDIKKSDIVISQNRICDIKKSLQVFDISKLNFFDVTNSIL